MRNGVTCTMTCTSSEAISLLHCNVRSLNKNYDPLVALLTRLDERYNVVAISETWLKKDEFMNIPNYRFLSLPRLASSRGGGVALYISSQTIYKILPNLTETKTGLYDMLFAELDCGVTVGVIYRPPESNTRAFLEKLEDVLCRLANKNNKTIICGDFNINITDPSSTEYRNLLLSYGFQNHITDPTRVTLTSCSTIDHILSNFEDSSVKAGVITENVADHFPTFIVAPNAEKNLQKEPTVGHGVSRWNYEATKRSLQETNFSQINFTDTNNAYDTFSTLFKSCCIAHKFVSRRAAQLYSPICPWMNEEILKLIRLKEHWYNKMKQNKDNDYYREKFRVARNLSLSTMRKRKKQYFSSRIAKANGSSKEIWRTINLVMKSSQQCNILPDLNILNCDQAHLVSMFNDFFISIGTSSAAVSDETSRIILPSPCINTFVYVEITAAEIVGVARQMLSNKAMGHDEISVNLLKDNIDILCYPLQKLFNQAFLSGIYPEKLKIGRVVPIYKNGDPNDLANYRPITILSCINTLFEKLIAARIMNFVEKYNILVANQHGFRKNFSTGTAVHSVSEIVNSSLNKNRTTIGIFLDIKKAFDSVNHDILLQKLERYGFRGPAGKFFRSYLTNRTQFVQISHNQSTTAIVKTGVPQGSVLGPILFSLFINDYAACLRHSEAVLYADDTALLVSHHSLEEAELLANNDLKNTITWFNCNKLVLNIKKTKFIVFASDRKQQSFTCNLHLGGLHIDQVITYKYLGITLDSTLHWAPHIDELCKKLTFGCFSLVKARKHFSKQTLRMIYFGVFHTHLTYCVESWGFTYASYLARVTILQRRAIRIIAAAPIHASAKHLFSELNILPINLARDHKTAILVQRILTQNTPYHSSIFNFPKRETRQLHYNNLNLPITYNAYGRRLISFIGAKIWNNISCNIKLATNFVLSLKRFISSEVYNSPC